MLADWAAIAIENARLYRDVDGPPRRARARGARASRPRPRSRARSAARRTSTAILELIVKRGRALIDARACSCCCATATSCVIAAGAGDVAERRRRCACRSPSRRRGERPGRGTRRGASPTPPGELPISARASSASPARDRARCVPLVYRGRALGVLVGVRPRWTATGVHARRRASCWRPSRASAATAVATARNGRGRARCAARSQAAEAERRRWARELHDETLQALGGLKVLLSSARRGDDPEPMRTAMRPRRRAARPATSRACARSSPSCDPRRSTSSGSAPALTSLSQRTAVARSGLEVRAGARAARAIRRAELETTVYRLVQEALTNVVKHATRRGRGARSHSEGGALDVIVTDDGIGIGAARRRRAGSGCSACTSASRSPAGTWRSQKDRARTAGPSSERGSRSAERHEAAPVEAPRPPEPLTMRA